MFFKPAPIFALLFTLLAMPAFADDARHGFERINRCLADKKPQKCRNHITAGSIPLYDRFMSYGLADCLPANAVFVSEKPEGDHVLIRAKVKQGKTERVARLMFVQEEDEWQLDIPESLRAGMGDNWENQVNAVEQVYLMLRQQMGPKLNCGMLQGLTDMHGKS